MLPIYLDHQATTPIDPEVWEAMTPYFGVHFGNAASRHHVYGWEAEAAVKKARQQVAALLRADPDEVIWTSGATEATNLALKGVCDVRSDTETHIVTSAIEHKATLDTCKYLESKGASVSIVGADQAGLVSPDEIVRAVTGRTKIISIIHANNEIGTIQDIAAIGRIAAERGCLLHIDAAQSFGKLPVDRKAVGFDLASLSGHKIYGPKGVGALYVQKKPKRIKLVPLIHGGGHERGLRSGTLNVPGIVGFGKAAEIAARRMDSDRAHLEAMGTRLFDLLSSKLEGVKLNGPRIGESRLPGNLNVYIQGVESESLIMALADLALSNGSACSSLAVEPSHVLLACGLDESIAYSSIRIGLGRFNSLEEAEAAGNTIVEQAKRLRALGAL